MKMAIFVISVMLFGMISCISADNKCIMLPTDNDRRGMYSCVRADFEDINDIPGDAEWIRFTVSKVSNLPERAFARFALRGLSFYNCEIDNIDPNAFDGLDKLEQLTFYGSNIHVLRASWFKGLSSLTHLFLDRNDMVYIEPNVFPLISNLKQLNIEDNNLNCLPSQAFAPLKKLEYARIGKNPWLCSCYTELLRWMNDQQINYGLRNVKKERLECMMEHIPQYRDYIPPPYQLSNNFSESETGYIEINREKEVLCFGNNISALSEIPKNVRSIKFVNSDISKIPQFAFLRFGNSLINLYFHNCSIRKIHPDAFAGLAKLDGLYLFGNSFGAVRSEWFRDLHSLESLALDENDIDYIEPSVFPLLNNLKYLSLGNNRLNCISTNEFNSLRHLRVVDLAHNPWNCTCQEQFRKWLHGNRVRYIISRGECVNGQIQESEDLFEQSFEIRGTRIPSQNTGLPRIYDDISTDTETSEAQRAEITREEADHNRKIKIANFEYYMLYNNLQAGAQNGYDTIVTTELDYELEKIKRDVIPENFSIRIPSLSMENSYIVVGGEIWDVLSISSEATAIRFENSAIPEIFDGMFSRFSRSLQRLEFLNCNVQDIEPQAFKGLSNLQELIFNDNQMQVVKSAWFDGIPNLRILNLARNYITQIDDGVFKLLTNLELLWISDNQLEGFEVKGFSYLKKLKGINMASNPWSCVFKKKLKGWFAETEDCNTEYTDFGPTNDKETNSIDSEESDVKKEIEEPTEIEDIEMTQGSRETRETISTTENLKIVEIEDNNAASSLTGAEIWETVPTPTTAKPESFSNQCRFHQFNRMTESRWWCRGGDVSIMDQIPSSAERIDVTDSNIPVIPANAFIRFSNLTRLIFYNSSIRDVDPKAFATLEKLEWLMFLNNSLPTIRSSWFHGLTNVTRLGLVRNSITEIESDVFEHLPNLKQFSIQDNNLRCIYTKSLSSLKYLQKVTIQNNPWKWRCREELTQFFDGRNISYVKSETYQGQHVVANL